MDNQDIAKMGKLVITDLQIKKATVTVAAFILGDRLEYIKVCDNHSNLMVGSVVTGKVKNVVPSIPAAFVGISESEEGFLSTKNLKYPIITNREFKGKLSSGDEILVRVEKDAIKTKGKTLSDEISLAGRYCVVKNAERKINFSGKIGKQDREILINILKKHAICTEDKDIIGYGERNFGITIKMQAQKARPKKLIEDIEQTISAYIQFIQRASVKCLYTLHRQEKDLIEVVLEELKSANFLVEEVVVEDAFLYEKLCGQESISKLDIRLYQDSQIELKTLYGLKEKIETALSTKVWLPSGAYLCIEQTEAMTVVDVNSGKATVKSSKENLTRQVNLEAADEILRQIRIRNLTGIIIVDFINYGKEDEIENQKELKKRMEEKLIFDFSKIEIFDFTKLGLLEITRAKKSKSLQEEIF